MIRYTILSNMSEFGGLHQESSMPSTIANPVFFELEIKKSRFLAYIEPIQNKQDAKAVLERLHNQYPDARHICYSFVTKTDTAMNDDGEPSGTAGKPIYNVLHHKDLTNVIAVVVRYFGGIKLGAGGLTRAYGGAVSQAIEQAQIITPIKMSHFELIMPYEFENKIRHLLESFSGQIGELVYQQQLLMPVSIEEEMAQDFLDQLNERGQGKIEVIKQESPA